VTPFVGKYKRINQLHSSENLFNLSNNYGLVRQHNLLSLKATTSQYNTFLDNKGFNRFLSYSNLKNASTIGELNFFDNLSLLGKMQSGSGTYYSLASTLNVFNSTTGNA
jgi:hypothetical protein